MPAAAGTGRTDADVGKLQVIDGYGAAHRIEQRGAGIAGAVDLQIADRMPLPLERTGKGLVRGADTVERGVVHVEVRVEVDRLAGVGRTAGNALCEPGQRLFVVDIVIVAAYRKRRRLRGRGGPVPRGKRGQIQHGDQPRQHKHAEQNGEDLRRMFCVFFKGSPPLEIGLPFKSKHIYFILS